LRASLVLVWANVKVVFCHGEWERTKIEWAIEGQCHTEPSCSRRENAVGLGNIRLPQRLGVFGEESPTISTPSATQTSKSGDSQ
jgi:hypothetical protein